MSISNDSKINQLLTNGRYQGLYFSEWLKKQGYSNQLLKKYRESGWLVSLARGVMYRKGERLSAIAALASFNIQMKKQFRIASHSALELSGFNHYVPMGKPTMMVCYPKQVSPKWFNLDLFDYNFQLFQTEAFSQPEVQTMNVRENEVLVSSPEQAFLECIYLVPQQYNYMDLYYIMEQLTTLRPNVVQRLLETTTNFRVKRMFLFMAEKANHYWFDMLDTSRIELGTSKLQLVENGVYNTKYRITIPKELNDYE